MEQDYLQQGDVILRIVSEIPKTAKKKVFKDSKKVVEVGEGTHVHYIEDAADAVDIFEDEDGTLWMTSEAPFELLHSGADHAPTYCLPNQIYRYNPKVDGVQEFDYEEDEARRSFD